MAYQQDQGRPAGMVIGSLIATVFGLIFIEVNSGDLPSDRPQGIRITGAVVAAGLLLAILPQQPADYGPTLARSRWVC